MGGLSAALGAATTSLAAFSQGLAVVENNIANAATPGYARQRVLLSPVVLPQEGRSIGVRVDRVEALRSRLLDLQVLVARQGQEQAARKTQFYDQIEPNFSLGGEGSIGQSVDGLFAAFSQLAVSPGDSHLRTAVKGAAEAVAGSFRRVSSNLTGQRQALDSEVRSVVSRVNGLLQEIKQVQLARGRTSSGEPNAAADTRLDQLLNQLSEQVSFSFIEQQDGVFSLVTDGGSTLINGERIYPLAVTLTPSGVAVLDSQGANVTAGIQGRGGSLGAILEARNTDLPRLIGEVNRLAKSVADRVNEQLARGVDLNGAAGRPLFLYAESLYAGASRAAGTSGAATPAPPVSVDVSFSGGVTGSISATLDSFFVAAGPPSGAAAGDTVSVTFLSADGAIGRTITTAPLLGGETAVDLAVRLNDQIALEPKLAALASFSSAGGALKLVLSEQAGQGFSFTSTTSNLGFTTGLEGGGSLGGHSAEEIAAALNAEVASQSALSAAGVRFSVRNGEVTVDGDVLFSFSAVDNDPAATGFSSGLGGVSASAGGALAASSLTVAPLGPAQIAAGAVGSPTGNDNALALEGLAEQAVLGGLTFTDFYAGLVTAIGIDSQNTRSELESKSQVLLAAENLRDSLSGVDINEEAVRLLEFEQAFNAMLRVIQVIDELSNRIIEIGA